jgi:multiple sugar transport system permease protein
MRSHRRWISTTILSALALAMVAPFLYMVSVSFMEENELLRWPPPLLPSTPQTGNYAAALEALPFARLFVNSAILAGCVVVGQVLTSAAAGYAFARMRFPGRDRVFLAFLAVLTVPTIMLLIPRFLLVEALGWVDTYAGLISTEVVSVWGIFLMRQFFLTLPRDVEDAARLDGAREWTLFWRVMLPLAKPAVAALAVLAFMEQWRNFLWPLVLTRSPEMQVAEVGLASLHTLYATNWPYQMAAAVMVTLPLVVVCLVAQRYLVGGLRLAGPK